MTESEPDSRGLDAQAANDRLAGRLLAARRALNARDIDPDVRTRLYLRFRAICTSLKMPAANRGRLAQRLDRLIADAQIARRGTCAASARPSLVSDAIVAEPDEQAGLSDRQ
jgi:hypothetical protein